MALDKQAADLALSTLITVWRPAPPLTTADVLDGMGVDAAAQFATHASRVAEIWNDPARRPLLAAAATAKGVALTADGNGAPVFGVMKPFTNHPDGTITLNT